MGGPVIFPLTFYSTYNRIIFQQILVILITNTYIKTSLLSVSVCLLLLNFPTNNKHKQIIQIVKLHMFSLKNVSNNPNLIVSVPYKLCVVH